MSKHSASYTAARVIRYEARCECGWTAVEATPTDSHHALKRHLEGALRQREYPASGSEYLTPTEQIVYHGIRRVPTSDPTREM